MRKYLDDERHINIFTAAVVTAFMLFLNFNCLYASDDWHFKFIWEQLDLTNGIERIDSLDDVAVSVSNYYNLSGGRGLCHGIIFLVNIFDKAVFNVINSLVFTAFGYVSYRLIRRVSSAENKFMFPLICMIYVLFLPYFGDNCIWLSGAVNYLWSGLLMVSCFMCAEKYAEKSDFYRTVILFTSVLFSSLTNEMTGGMIIIYMLFTFVAGRKFVAKDIIPFIPAVIGTFIVVSAPGNSARLANEMSEPVSMELIFKSAVSHFTTVFNKYYIHVLIFLFALLLAARLRINLKSCGGIKLFLTGIAGIIALSATGENSQRPYFIGCIALICGSICSIVYIYRLVKKEYENNGVKIGRALSLASAICLTGQILFSCAASLEFTFIMIIPAAVMLILSVAGLCLPFIIRYAEKISSDESLKKKIGNPKKCVKLACIVTLVPYLVLNSVIFVNNTALRKEWMDNVILHLSNGSYNMLTVLEPAVEFSGVFDPDEAYCFDDTKFTLSWFAYYNGYYIDFDKETVEQIKR